MKLLPDKYKDFFIRYKWVVIFGVPILFFVLLTTLLFSPEGENNKTDNPSGVPLTQRPEVNENKTVSDEEREGNEESVEERPGRQSKETLPDGTTRYTFASQNSNRPHLIITKGAEDILFQRTVMLPNIPVEITDYTSSYGQAKWIFKGSNFYGADAQTHIYPERGFAFIGNPTTGAVLEQHVFPPLKVEEYVAKYGDDIPAQP